MFRYIALVWDARNAEQSLVANTYAQRIRAISTDWMPSVQENGLAIFCAGVRPGTTEAYVLPNHSGAILGTLFNKSVDTSTNQPICRKATLTGDRVRRLLANEGRSLTEEYWGRYVAFLRDPDSSTVWILRDPIGDLPCLLWSQHGAYVVFSRIDDVQRIGMAEFSVDWSHIALRASAMSFHEDESALMNVQTIHPGECFRFRDGGIARTYYWHPFQLRELERTVSFEEASESIRVTTKACTNAWISLFPRILHELSGGLDSSIVLGCADRGAAKERITCVNFRTRDPDSDERSYARLVAQSAGCELVERVRASIIRLEDVLKFQPSAGPCNTVLETLEVGPLIRELAEDVGAQALFSGDGGDFLFYRSWSQLAVADCLYSKRGYLGALRLAVEVSELCQLSVWNVLGIAIRHGLLRRPWNVPELVLEHRKLISREAAVEAVKSDNFLSSRFRELNDVPPGKLMHILGTARPLLFYDPLAEAADPEPVQPLTSQPLVEICLRIPTFVHVRGGEERALARSAFASDVPGEVIRRTWKGGVERRVKDLMLSNLPFVRSLLMDGALVKQHVLDRAKVDAALQSVPSRSSSFVGEIFDYVCIEAWLQQWNSTGARAAA
jgi:asparagine synthase (glutamine-hydrolysing)